VTLGLGGIIFELQAVKWAEAQLEMRGKAYRVTLPAQPTYNFVAMLRLAATRDFFVK